MEPIKEVTLEKIYGASPETLWQAWTQPEMLKQWWGPNDVTIPECEVDLKVGGKFYIVMEAGEAMGPYKGTRWPMDAKFTVVEPNSKLFYAAKAWTEGHNDNGETLIDQTTEVAFTKEDGPDAPAGTGKTKVTVRAVIHNIGPAAKMAAEGMQMGFTQQLDKLNTFLAAKK